MTRFKPRHFVAPVAAFGMALTLGFYVRSSIRRAKWESQYERRRRGEHWHHNGEQANVQSLPDNGRLGVSSETASPHPTSVADPSSKTGSS
ncbi:uncharacterized protein EI90DRAFT_3062928 [Cantharellus anzutake]|uniref:uncharacterized protein n=1 Tax=Cantharellus anzutake TaxID=1750568 RepID=UPI0019080A3E|nr:uncharacterized protein EI90DRAFT_3062928 [Cantharellus anzutake]KAF8329533.1 hypothetical protein EI90DRAFT_3062928 [Cantharellus anzutake]